MLCSLNVGCGSSVLADRQVNPVIEGYANEGYFSGPVMGTIVTTGDRRVIAIKLKAPGEGKFCAEPMPDATTNALSNLKIQAERTQTGQLTLDRQQSLITEALYNRSHSVQWSRDLIFSLCNAKLNDFMDDREYATLFEKIIDKGSILMEKEFIRPQPPIVRNQ